MSEFVSAQYIENDRTKFEILALDRCQNFFSAQYLENDRTEFDQI